ncbi:hypothetical protein AALP_AAs68076U000100 [Arabis alpina]|uniref:Leucine-rich repeat-containing N-terminal plant-type domain-containing protein n=1 Tax=Arabis alpina TaxID=50452 RepID=A0A087G1F4_ARAAL|nr:hypothetical protein AALP_AAs68076U000100 [Arabis alpina]
MIHSCSEERKMMILWSLCLIFALSNSILVVIASPSQHLCLPDQRDALWEFKNEFYVDSDVTNFEKMTEKWRYNTDCCSWDGVSCDPKTGKIVELGLISSSLNGPLRSNSSLFRLQHLQSLDLSYNNFSGILPDSIGNLKYLSVLRCSSCNLHGKLPSSLGNLSYLTHLYLSVNDFTSEGPNLQLVLPKLSSLKSIDLGSNQFKGTLPSNMSSLSKLEYFGMSGNSFSGSIPSSLFMIPSLLDVSLERNHFSGPLEIGNISSPSKLRYLIVGENNFNGPIPGSLLKLVGLEYLDLSFWNTGRGIVDLSFFSHFISLRDLDLSGIHLNISSTLHLPMINTLTLSSCNISEFPKFLENQTKLRYLDISANQIEGQLPEGFGRLPRLWYVNISDNLFSGKLTMLPNSTRLFVGSDNRFSGEIRRGICELFGLQVLDLSNNNFSGSIPRCLESFNTTLWVLHLQNNSLSGVFPEESISLGLISLNVGHNQLSGELPKSLINYTDLKFLNVEGNRINDTFPFGVSLLPHLQVLVLRSNEFYGPIYSPRDSLSFPNLRIFDISDNRFSGVFPSDYFVGWNAVSSVVEVEYYGRISVFAGGIRRYYYSSVVLTNKGVKMELVGRVFTMYKIIDVSRNRFEGDIPESIGSLKGLIVLNMSYNAFTGHIPQSLTNLTNLQSLDLSQNRLSGEIPPQLGKLTFISRMNFSYNMLEGPIPQGTQIQSQNGSSFAENPGLCGAPLEDTCGGGGEEEETEQEQDEEKEEKEQVLSWTAAAIAYVPGVVCGLTIAHILTS